MDRSRNLAIDEKKLDWNIKVRQLLGNPTILSSHSIQESINLCLHWRFNSDGEEEEATVQFFRDRVISYTSPF